MRVQSSVQYRGRDLIGYKTPTSHVTFFSIKISAGWSPCLGLSPFLNFEGLICLKIITRVIDHSIQLVKSRMSN